MCGAVVVGSAGFPDTFCKPFCSNHDSIDVCFTNLSPATVLIVKAVNVVDERCFTNLSPTTVLIVEAVHVVDELDVVDVMVVSFSSLALQLSTESIVSILSHILAESLILFNVTT